MRTSIWLEKTPDTVLAAHIYILMLTKKPNGGFGPQWLRKDRFAEGPSLARTKLAHKVPWLHMPLQL